VSEANPQQPDADQHRAMAERCLTLGLAYWYVKAGSHDLTEPQDGGNRGDRGSRGDGGRWLRSAVVRDRVWSLGVGWLEEDNPQPVQIEPGCWAFASKSMENRRVVGVVIALRFEPSMFEGSWFKSVCRKVGADPQQARNDLSIYTGAVGANVNTISATLRQSMQDHAQISRDTDAIDQFSEQLLNTYEETNLLFRIARMMNNLEDPGDLIPTFCNQILPVLPFRWIAVRFWKHRRKIKGLTDRLVVAGELPCENQVFDQVVIEQFEDNTHEDWTRLLEPSAEGITGLIDSEVVVQQVTHDGEVVGVLLAGNKAGDCPMQSDVTSGEMMFLEAATNLLGVFHENLARFDEQKQLFMGTLQALTASIDAKDQYTRGHSERVAYLGAKLAKVMGMDSNEIERVHTTGLVHDVGKIGVPEAVLSKAGKLTDEEFDLIKLHPVTGYNILKGIPTIDPILPGVLYHHERWDGRGYPEGLKGEDIPQIGRLLALADTFDAMSSTRSYRPSMPRTAVLEEIRRCAGTQFDPSLAPLFVDLDFSGYDRLVAKHGAASRSAA
jgi:HD-GYP domain-containing protein (c-di-GMP phosphodiesterase class II)